MVEQHIATEQHLCSFCENLPTTTPWSKSGRISHCPLCHGEILETPSGVTYRITVVHVDEPMPPPKQHYWRWILAGVAAAAMIGLAVWLIVRLGTGSQSDQPTSHTNPIPSHMLVAKPFQGDASSRAKPLPHSFAAVAKTHSVEAADHEPEPDKAFVKYRAPRPELELVQAKPWQTLTPVKTEFVGPLPMPVTSWRLHRTSEEDLRKDLLSVPEIDLFPDVKANGSRTNRQEVANLMREKADAIRELNKEKVDGFIHDLKKKRSAFAGLPFLLGKDCQLSPEKAKELGESSRAVRRLETALERSTSGSFRTAHPLESKGARFWQAWAHGGRNMADISALSQMLAVEETSYRDGLVRHLSSKKPNEVTKHLVRLAVFDLDAKIRHQAVDALGVRSPSDEDYTAELTAYLRHPWPQTVSHAAEAIARLKRTDLIPKLIDQMAQPAATTPVEKEKEQGRFVVRELVRINHARNCMLCHAPSSNTKEEPVRGVVPSPCNELPRSLSEVYYAERRGIVVVRADVTYLRQDFSVMMPVKDHAPWPAMQRYDFVVRTREMSADEAKKWPPGQSLAAQYDRLYGLHLALRDLTGLNPAMDANAWREVTGSLRLDQKK